VKALLFEKLRWEDGYYGFELNEVRQFIEAGIMDGVRQLMREPLSADELSSLPMKPEELAVIGKLPSWIRMGVNVHARIVPLRYAKGTEIAKAVALRTRQREQIFGVERNLEALRGFLANHKIRCLNDLLKAKQLASNARRVKGNHLRKLPVKRRQKPAARKRKVSA
jgi:hypothetical protein